MILNPRLPFAPWVDPTRHRLPGVMPLARADWLLISDVYAAQMAERARLLAEHPADVLACLPQAQAAAVELLDEVLHDLPALGFTMTQSHATCPMAVVSRWTAISRCGHSACCCKRISASCKSRKEQPNTC